MYCQTLSVETDWTSVSLHSNSKRFLTWKNQRYQVGESLRYGLDKNSDWVVLALYPIIEVTVRDPDNEWLREHYEEVAYFYTKHLEGRLEEVDSRMV